MSTAAKIGRPRLALPRGVRGAMAKRMISAREGAGLSVIRLSKQTGISPSLIHRYERGVTDPGASNLIAIADACRCRVDRLFPEKTKK